jgi:hypothetical protein
MRKLSSLGLAAMFAVTTFATPASAQQMQASGSCGSSAGNYGLTDVNSDMQSIDTETVNALYYVNYSGVPAPTTVGVIIRQSGELESQVAVVSFTAQNSGGMFEGALRANTSPDAQGYAVGGNSGIVNHDNPGGSSNVSSNGIDAARRGSKDGPPDGNRGSKPGGSGTQGGIGPGEYVFYIYTGERKDVYNVKEGTVARDAFVADEKGFLGWFSCGVSTDQGSGPG